MYTFLESAGSITSAEVLPPEFDLRRSGSRLKQIEVLGVERAVADVKVVGAVGRDGRIARRLPVANDDRAENAAALADVAAVMKDVLIRPKWRGFVELAPIAALGAVRGRGRLRQVQGEPAHEPPVGAIELH